MQECQTQYGDLSQSSIDKYEQELAKGLTISLITSCKSYFVYADSARYIMYSKMNKDSLIKEKNVFENITEEKRDKKYYDARALLYFELGLYDNALQDLNKVLSIDSSDPKGLYLKAWIVEIQGKYEEAIELYDRVANLSKNYLFYIYAKIAERKKNGL